MPNRHARKKIRISRRLTYGILITILAVSVCMLAGTWLRYRIERKAYDEAARAVSTPAPQEVESTPTPAYLADSWAPPAATAPVTVDFAAVQAEGKRVTAWIYSEDTPINYPVVQHSDTDFYLTHNYKGRESSGGSIFFDTRVDAALSSDNVILFGHNMKDSSMFGSLTRYTKQTYFDEHRCLYLLTPAQNYRIDVFAAWMSESDISHFPVSFASAEARRAFYDEAREQSGFSDEADVYHSNYQMVSLVTCAYATYIQDARFQVNGWLVPID